MSADLKDIEFEEAYVVESVKQGKRSSIFERDEKLDLDALKYESEDTDYMVQMKIKFYNERITKEQMIKTNLYNEQRNNLNKIGAYCLFIVIFSLILVIIEKFAHITRYTRMADITITDLRSIGALCIYPATFLFIIGIVVCIAWIIVLLKRSAVTEDPHDRVKRRRETIIKKCDDRIEKYNKEVFRLQMKLLNLK